MPESCEDLARDTDGQAPGRGVDADVTGEPMPHDPPGPDAKHGRSEATVSTDVVALYKSLGRGWEHLASIL
jgi:hypothetical protein